MVLNRLTSIVLCYLLKDDAEVLFQDQTCCNGRLVPAEAGCASNTLTYNGTYARVIPDCQESKTVSAFVAPKTAEGTALVVRTLRGLRQRFTVFGGGHSMSCASVCSGCVTLSTELMSSSEVVKARDGKDYITVSGAATLRDLMATWVDTPYMLPHGEFPSISVIGHALGGGIGWTTRAYGFLCDRIVGAEVVLPSGRLVRVFDAEHEGALDDGISSTHHHRDLLWALRGSGHIGLGVVTRLWFEPVVRPAKILYGAITFPLASVADMRRHFQATCDYFEEGSNKTVNALHLWSVVLPIQDLSVGRPLTEEWTVVYIPDLDANETEVHDAGMAALEELMAPYRAAGVEPISNTVKLAEFGDRWRVKLAQADSAASSLQGTCASRAVLDKSAMCNDAWINDAAEEIYNLAQFSTWLPEGEFPYFGQEMTGGAALSNDPHNVRTSMGTRGQWLTYDYCRWRMSDATPMAVLREKTNADFLKPLSNAWYYNYADFHVTEAEQLFPVPAVREKLAAIKRRYDPQYFLNLDDSEPRLF